jgi:hypothetical protein
MKLSGNKKFIFTIIDDTDDSFCPQINEVYDVLHKNGLRTTKTLWVYPVRDSERSKGECLQDEAYKNFVLDIKNKGFELALHNVGSGDYNREEIIKGLAEYEKILGEKPKIHVNHSYNPDNIYCGPKRFSFPFNIIVKYLYSSYNNFSGEIKKSRHYWADIHKKFIKYSRNYEIDNINTFKRNSYMPYRDKKYDKYCNYWYSSTFAPNQWMFNHIVTKKSIDKLEREGGVCILYTHLGYYYKNGQVDQGFKEMISYIGKKKTGLFLPVSDVLDILNEQKKKNKIKEYLPFFKKFLLEFNSLKTRIKYRYIKRIDDYHFKKSNLYNEINIKK